MEERVRYGIIGYGAFAERAIAPAMRLSKNSELVAVQKRSQSAAEEKARALGIPLAFDSPEKLARHPDVDAVFVASAVVQHAADTLAAAKAGKHVLVEKPMAMNAAEAESMIAACREANVRLMVGQMVRLSPLAVRMKELIRSGRIGTVSLVKTEYLYDARLSKRRWLLDKETAGGGASFDIGVHCLDTIRFILGDEVVSVKSQIGPRTAGHDAEKTSLIALKFAQGTPAGIVCSFASPVRRAFIEVIGQDGILSAENFTMNNLTIPLNIIFGKDGAVSETIVEPIAVPDLYEAEVTAFSEAILNNTASPIPGEEGLKNQRVLDEVIRPA